MKALHSPRSTGHPARPERRGAALLLSLIVLFVLVAIVFQISIGTGTDARVARNDVGLATMDLACESALLEVVEMLKADAPAAGGEGGAGAGGLPGMGGGDDLSAGEGGEGGEEGGSVDSKQDQWGQPQRTQINEIDLRILIQDEESKYNLLNMLRDDEGEAEKAHERVVEILDLCRAGTSEDIDSSTAREMADAMREHMRDRTQSILPKPKQLSDVEGDEERGLPMGLREFVVVDPFHEGHFRDYLDEDGLPVHSIGSFLTVWTCLSTDPPLPQTESPDADSGDRTADEAGATSFVTGPGIVVNINTAPLAVLRALMPDHAVDPRLWDDLLEYRNLEEEDGDPDADPVLDEFGEEQFEKRVFDSLDELEELYPFTQLGDAERRELEAMLTVESSVFSVFITARRSTGPEEAAMAATSRREQEQQERRGAGLERTVRAILWRRAAEEEETEIIPLLRWEVLDYAPYEVLDFPDDE
ncbi:MAG: type II secretion system protein GspK [Planctomycetota bacterium]|nr:type II secretion system protein GspK [Planctomycetota bacterium]MDP6839707.1 type II secretion system protein GspK [Planctomycetota bacterium]MDP6956006.1 type II secretion system protein GspK [Planctomycetota bacterium]